MKTIYASIADAVVHQMRHENAVRRMADLKRPIGTHALHLGITDYRKKPNPSVHASDWAVWLVEWDGSKWARKRRLSGSKTLSEAHDAMEYHRIRLGHGIERDD